MRKTSKFDASALGPSRSVMIDHYEVEVCFAFRHSVALPDLSPSRGAAVNPDSPNPWQIFAEETAGINSGAFFLEGAAPAAPARKKFKAVNDTLNGQEAVLTTVSTESSRQRALFDPTAEGALVLLESPALAVVVDPYVSRILREHQREGVRFMYVLEINPWRALCPWVRTRQRMNGTIVVQVPVRRPRSLKN